MANKIRKGDDVIIMAGKDKGKRGTVLRIAGDDRVVVENINLARKHVKPNPNKGEQGGIIDKEMPLHVSNVALYNPATEKGDRVGFKTLDDGRKVRVFKSNGEVVDVWGDSDDKATGSLQAERRTQLMEKFGYSSIMQVPRIEKITLNMGVGEAVGDKKVMEFAVGDMEKIAGQKAIVTKAKKSVAGFKIRDGWPIGCKVTLRRERMYEFLDRLINIAIPRIRDFRGLNGKSFDGRGNYSMGVKEQIIFPEVEYDKVDALRGMDITITTSAKNDEECRALLDSFSFPFK